MILDGLTISKTLALIFRIHNSIMFNNAVLFGPVRSPPARVNVIVLYDIQPPLLTHSLACDHCA